MNNINTSIIAPSLLSANYANLGAEAQAVLRAGADWIHIDVMDNHYVPNLSFGPALCEALIKMGIQAFLDVHLMVNPVDALMEQFAQVGASSLTIHPQTTPDLWASLDRIRSYGCKTGLAFNPETPIEQWAHMLREVDLVLMMSVNPGFGGQSFIPQTVDKIKAMRQLLDRIGSKARLSVDGGIHLQNIASVFEAGADTFVMGSAIFGSKNYSKVIQELREILFVPTRRKA